MSTGRGTTPKRWNARAGSSRDAQYAQLTEIESLCLHRGRKLRTANPGPTASAILYTNSPASSSDSGAIDFGAIDLSRTRYTDLVGTEGASAGFDHCGTYPFMTSWLPSVPPLLAGAAERDGAPGREPCPSGKLARAALAPATRRPTWNEKGKRGIVSGAYAGPAWPSADNHAGCYKRASSLRRVRLPVAAGHWHRLAQCHS
jgi:hypothetical protein